MCGLRVIWRNQWDYSICFLYLSCYLFCYIKFRSISIPKFITLSGKLYGTFLWSIDGRTCKVDIGLGLLTFHVFIKSLRNMHMSWGNCCGTYFMGKLLLN